MVTAQEKKYIEENNKQLLAMSREAVHRPPDQNRWQMGHEGKNTVEVTTMVVLQRFEALYSQTLRTGTSPSSACLVRPSSASGKVTARSHCCYERYEQATPLRRSIWTQSSVAIRAIAW
jgi:hypothetical protein